MNILLSAHTRGMICLKLKLENLLLQLLVLIYDSEDLNGEPKRTNQRTEAPNEVFPVVKRLFLQ